MAVGCGQGFDVPNRQWAGCLRLDMCNWCSPQSVQCPVASEWMVCAHSEPCGKVVKWGTPYSVYA